MAVKKKKNENICQFCITIRLFLLAVIFIFIISFSFGNKISFESFINAKNIGNIIFIALAILFLIKFYLHIKKPEGD